MTTERTCPRCDSRLRADGHCPTCAETVIGAPPTAKADFTGPKQIAGYRILRELGAGGMGAVYEAYEEKMHRKVALKVMSRHQAPSAKSQRRFELEAWIAGKLDHPNLVKVYERGDWEELHFYSMELIDGGSLHDVIRNMRQWGRDDRWDLVFGTHEYVHWVLKQIIATARGLDHAHRQGVVHRDVKPMNILLSCELETVKIADFGLALNADEARMTTAGKILGTLRYMAPEQILGKQDQIDPRTDVYALGVTLFEMLTLQLPYEGRTQQLYMSAVLTSEAQRASKLNNLVSRDLETVIRKSLEKARRDRYAGAGAFADDLENVLNLRPITAKPNSAWSRSVKWVRRKPIHTALIAALVVAVPAVAVVAVREVQSHRADLQSQIEDLVQRARFHEDRKRHAERLADAVDILALEPENLQGLRHSALSRAFLAEQTSDAAARERLGRAALRDAARLTDLLPERAWPHAVRGFVLRSLGDLDAARGERDLAQALRTDDPSPDEIDLDARLAMAESDYDRALKLFGLLAILQPNNALAVASRGAAYDFLGEPDKAANEYRLALAFNPELYEPHVDLARLLMQVGVHDQAGRYLERAVELQPERWHAHSVRADLLVQLGNVELGAGRKAEATRLYADAGIQANRAIERSPDQPEAHVNLGIALMQQSRTGDSPDHDLIARAQQAYDHALAAWKTPPREGEARRVYLAALNNSCDALIELGNLDKATTACSAVAEIQPDDPLPFYNLAGIHAMRGEVDRALDFLRLDLDKGDTDWEWLQGDPWFESLRGDRRFAEILERMKLAADPADG